MLLVVCLLIALSCSSNGMSSYVIKTGSRLMPHLSRGMGRMNTLRAIGNKAGHFHLKMTPKDRPKVVDRTVGSAYPEDSERAIEWANRSSPVLLFLDSIGLKKYHPNFMESGFNTMEHFLDMRNYQLHDPIELDLDLDAVAMARGDRRTFKKKLPDLTDEQATAYIAEAKQFREDRLEREEEERTRREERQRVQQEEERLRQKEEAEKWRAPQEFQKAVNLWCSDPVAAEKQYGHISTWDTSAVTSMAGLFSGQGTFNGDISGWDVSSVTDMSDMFNYASSFNQPL
jgi:surface protein